MVPELMGLEKEPEEKSEFIDVSDETLKEMLLLGIARPIEGGYEITPKFQEWLREWGAQGIKEHPLIKSFQEAIDGDTVPMPPLDDER